MSEDDDKPFGVTGRHQALHDWADFKGHERPEERAMRLAKERKEEAMLAEAERATEAFYARPDVAKAERIERQERDGLMQSFRGTTTEEDLERLRLILKKGQKQRGEGV